DTRVGVADSAMAAELAAAVVAPDARSTGLDPCITVVPPGTDAQFLASHPLTALTGAGAGAASPATAESGGKRARGRGRSESGSSAATVTTLISSLRDVGLETCGDLAQLTRAAVELRF